MTGTSVELAANCPVTAVTVSPFGGLFVPDERHRDRKQFLLQEKGDDGGWVSVSRSGLPVPRTAQGEQAVSRWRWMDGQPDLELQGAWLAEGSLRQGVRAKSIFADLLITERTLRLGLSVGALPRRGPWIFDDKDGKLKEIRGESSIFAASFNLSEITWVRGNRSGLAFGTPVSGLTMLGKASRWLPEAKEYETVKMPVLAEAVARAVCACANSSASPERRAAAADLSRSDLTAAFSGFRDTLRELPAE